MVAYGEGDYPVGLVGLKVLGRTGQRNKSAKKTIPSHRGDCFEAGETLDKPRLQDYNINQLINQAID